MIRPRARTSAARVCSDAQSPSEARAGAAGGGATGGKDDVLDAEFEEVKDKDGKAS